MNKQNLGVGCVELNSAAKRNVAQVLRSERLSYGPFLKKFEKEFCSGHQVKFGIAVNSGTSALRIAVACLKETEKWKEGDEIIVPAVTFVATSNVVMDHGLKPVFVDVDNRTYNIDPSKIEERINKRTRAIMVVHLFGQPAEMSVIMALARKHKLKIIEDSCETMFTKYKGRSVGSFGDIACFSTYVAHLIVTGVGGIATTNNRRYAEILRSLANHGRDNIYINIDDDKNQKERVFKELISRRFKFVRPGYSFRLTEFEGAVGCAQLEIADKILLRRQRNAAYLTQELKNLEKYLQLPWHPPHAGHAFMMYPIVLKKGVGVKKDDLINYLEYNGIETRDMLPLINQPFMKKMFKIKEKDYPVASWINHYGFYIGCHQKMRKPELDYIIKLFYKFFRTKNL